MSMKKESFPESRSPIVRLGCFFRGESVQKGTKIPEDFYREPLRAHAVIQFNEHITILAPHEILGSGAVEVLVSPELALDNKKYTLRLDAFPLESPDYETRHYGYVDIPLEGVSHGKFWISGDTVYTRNGAIGTFAWKTPLNAPGYAVWNISLWDFSSPTPEMLLFKSHQLYWAQQESYVPQNEGVLDRDLVPLYFHKPEKLLELGIRALEQGRVKEGMTHVVNTLRLRPSRKEAFIKALTGRIGGISSGKVDQAALKMFRNFAAVLGIASRSEVIDELFLRENFDADDKTTRFIARYVLIEHLLATQPLDAVYEEFKFLPMRCMHPYATFFTGHNNPDDPKRTILPCCPYLLPTRALQKDVKLDVGELWNSSEMAVARFDVQREMDERKSSGCRNCFSLGVLSEGEILESRRLSYENGLFPLTEKQRQNVAAARAHYLRGEAELSSYPVYYYINFGQSCNLRCTMCSAKWMGYDKKLDMTFEQVAPILEHIDTAKNIGFSGGEPLILRSVKEFVDAAVQNGTDHVLLSFTTNGTTLHKAISWLAPVKHLDLAFSVDSAGDAYETIRRGGKWPVVSKNIEDFKNMCASHDGRWTYSIGAVLMKSSVLGLKGFVDWVVQNGFDNIGFGAMQVSPEFPMYDEDLLGNRELFLRHPEIPKILDQAIEDLGDRPDSVSGLNYYKFLLKNNYSSGYGVEPLAMIKDAEPQSPAW
jgi:sulfatase maturation enzyme AslB (radical SAM superfamily)